MLTMGRTLQRRVQGLVVLTTMMVVALMFRLPYISDSSDSSHNVHQRREFIPYLIDSERVADGRKLSASFESRIQYENSNSEETGRLGAKNISLPKRTHQDSGFSIFKTDDTAKNKTVGANVDSHIRKESERKDGVASVALCDNECERFRKLIDSWPADRPRAGFYYLTKPSRLSRLNASLSSVDTYFNNRFHYPVIVFHEDDLNPYLDAIRSMTKSDVFFQRVQFITPDFLTKPIPKQIPCISSISYRFMCRFHAKLVYELPIIRSLQYYWRLDDDSLLLSDVTYDVFRYMERHSLQYGYLWRHWDATSCVQDLWESTERYVQERNVTTHFFQSWTKAWLYYNNFEIASTKMWLSPEYASYIEYIDRLGGMFYHRWGDAPIHGIAVSMFIPKNQTHLFHDIGYKHGSYKHPAQPNKTHLH